MLIVALLVLAIWLCCSFMVVVLCMAAKRGDAAQRELQRQLVGAMRCHGEWRMRPRVRHAAAARRP